MHHKSNQALPSRMALVLKIPEWREVPNSEMPHRWAACWLLHEDPLKKALWRKPMCSEKLVIFMLQCEHLHCQLMAPGSKSSYTPWHTVAQQTHPTQSTSDTSTISTSHQNTNVFTGSSCISNLLLQFHHISPGILTLTSCICTLHCQLKVLGHQNMSLNATFVCAQMFHGICPIHWKWHEGNVFILCYLWSSHLICWFSATCISIIHLPIHIWA